jgi:hypothetical protein
MPTGSGRSIDRPSASRRWRSNTKGGTSFARLTGVEGAQARATRLRLGEETIELLTFTDPGAPYLADIGCDDVRFQHIAIVVADMETAYLRLRASGGTAITRPAPQRLPATSRSCHCSSFVIRRGIRSNCSRSHPTTCRRAGGTPRIETGHALGSIIPPRRFPHGGERRVLPVGLGIVRRRALTQSRPGAGTG